VRAQLLPAAPAATPTPRPTARPTAAPTATPTTPGATAQPTPHKSLPSTATEPLLSRQGGSPDLGSILVLLLVGTFIGIGATLKINPSRRGVAPHED
jgi:hypothetical protein